MQEILVDGYQLVAEDLVEMLNDQLVAFHEVSLPGTVVIDAVWPASGELSNLSP
jgi:hypothetical protein